MQIAELTHQLESARTLIKIRDELIAERGLVFVNASDMVDNTVTDNGSTNQGVTSRRKSAHANGDSDPALSAPLLNGTGLSNGEANDQASSLKKSSSYTILSKTIADALKSIDGSSIGNNL